MQIRQRSTTDILRDLSRTRGVSAIVIVGPDGLVIESTGHLANANLDVLGAAISSAINGIAEMGNELNIGKFSDLFVTYQNAMIICFPAGRVICGIASSDPSAIGLIRHTCQKFIPELEQMF